MHAEKETSPSDKSPNLADIDNPSRPRAQFQDNRPLTEAQTTIQELARATHEGPIQRKNNTGLPDNLKGGMERLSGYSMDDVRVHYNSSKPADLQAHAYAQGTNIHIAPGQEKHLPHEAWHVVQQKQGRVRPTIQLAGVHVNNDSGLEREADAMGTKAARGVSSPVMLSTNPPNNTPTRPTAQLEGLDARSATLQKVHLSDAPSRVCQRQFNVEFSTTKTLGHEFVVEAVTYVRNSSETTGGPHITPNSLFAQQVVMSLVGKTFSEGYLTLMKLIRDNMLQPAEVEPSRLDNIYKLANEVALQYQGVRPEAIASHFQIQTLNKLALAYIRLRNSRKNAIVGRYSGRKEEGEEKEKISHQKAQDALTKLTTYNERGRSKGHVTALAQAIVEWCDTTTIKSARVDQIINSAEVKGWLKRHLNDAIIALGIANRQRNAIDFQLIVDDLREAYWKHQTIAYLASM